MFKTLMTATALTGVMALSANALELGADATAGISFDDGIAVNAGLGAKVDADTDNSEDAAAEGEAVAKADTEAQGYVEVAGSPFVGNAVTTVDGDQIGTVTEVYSRSADDQRLRIEIADETGIETPDAFWLPIPADAEADGAIVLSMSMAEFVSSVEANYNAD